MLVQQILKSKADDGVVTLPPGSTVGQAVELLSSRRIGAVVISPDGKAVAGILSERDVVRELGRRGPAVLNDRVDAIMTAKIVSCGRSDQTDSVLQKMTDAGLVTIVE